MLNTLLLRGGRVIDPASGHDAHADVAVVDGRIDAIGPDLNRLYPDATQIDCAGTIVTPGLIDHHAHVFPGLGDFCVEPDRAGVDTAVTTVVDGGTSGVATTGPAESIRRSHELGRLAVGRVADLTVLAVEDGPVALSDGYEDLHADRQLVAVGCVRDRAWRPVPVLAPA